MYGSQEIGGRGPGSNERIGGLRYKISLGS